MVDGLDDAEEGRRLEQTVEIDHKNSRLYSNFENRLIFQVRLWLL